jgi:ribosomal protein S18 acetylase RimI-like enzyme
VHMVMELVDCSREYWDFVRLLRSDDRVLNGFVKHVSISREEQEVYMGLHANGYRVALVDGVPAGFVGVVNNDIRVCTHPDFQGLGVGKFMIENIMKIFPGAFAKVKVDNFASVALFESCGFQKKFFIFEREINEA